MTFFHLVKFHFKLYIQNSYFVMVMLTSTVSLFLLQYIMAYSTNSLINESIWMRTGIFGLWSCGTTAAGIIGMQKWQGTILYLINNQVSDYQSLAAVVVPASLFGLCSFLVAYILCWLFQVPVAVSMATVIYILMFWLGAVLLDLVIASFFVLTHNAITYEELLTIPILLLSGLFPVPDYLSVIKIIGHCIIPIALPIQWLLKQEEFTVFNIIKYSCSLIVAYFISRRISTYLIKKAKKYGNIGGGI